MKKNSHSSIVRLLSLGAPLAKLGEQGHQQNGRQSPGAENAHHQSDILKLLGPPDGEIDSYIVLFCTGCNKVHTTEVVAAVVAAAVVAVAIVAVVAVVAPSAATLSIGRAICNLQK